MFKKKSSTRTRTAWMVLTDKESETDKETETHHFVLYASIWRAEGEEKCSGIIALPEYLPRRKGRNVLRYFYTT